MAVADREVNSKVLTYEDYLLEGETPGRYEIVDGVRHWTTSPHDFHQDIAQNIFVVFRAYQKKQNLVRAYIAPVDIVTRLSPIKVRQPDVLLISKERRGERERFDKTPWLTAPELVVEVLSPSESRRAIQTKLAEYARIGVYEAWLVYPETGVVHQWSLSKGETPSLVAEHSGPAQFHSLVFPDLVIDMASIFEY